MKTGEFRLKLYPKNFDAVRAFYADILGFPVTKEWNRGEDDRGTMFDVGGTTLELLSPEDEYEPFAGFGLSLEVPDIWELWDQFKSEKFIMFGIRHNDWGDTSFQIIDPEGLKISLFTKDEQAVRP